MNRTVRSLAEACAAHPFEEKWLLAPSLRVGHQWLDVASRAGSPALNVRVYTLRRFALQIAGPRLLELGSTPAGQPAIELLVDALWTARRGAAGGYLAVLPPGAALTRALARSLRALRLAGVDAARVRSGRFEVAEKGAELRGLLTDLGAALRDLRWADHAQVLTLAAEQLRAEGGAAWQRILLVPALLRPEGLEAALLAAVPSDRRIELPSDEPERVRLVAAAGRGGGVRAGAEGAAPDAGPPLAVAFAHAIGEANEVRAALRGCLAEGIPLDQIEILHTDSTVYVPLIHETALRLETGEGPLAHGVPVTYAEGLPAGVTRPGRALAAWVRWIREDFAQDRLVAMIREGLAVVPGERPGPNDAPRLAARLRRMGIGWGRDRYAPAFAAARDALRARAAEAAVAAEIPEAVEGDEAVARALSRRRAQESDLERLRASVLSWVARAPVAGASASEWLSAAQAFLQEVSGTANEIDNLARDRLVQEIGSLRETIGAVPGDVGLDAAEWLADLPEATRVGGSGPRPGCLHVDGVLHGGHSGRPRTIVMGLDEKRFPGAASEDPILLDSERRALSRELAPSAETLHRKLEVFGHLLAGLRGSVALSFTSRSLDEDRDLFPSQVVLDAYRTLSGNAEADLRELMAALPAPAAFAPAGAPDCLDETDWWLWRQESAGGASALREAVSRRFPHLGRGYAAAEARAGGRFTAWDGAVPEAGTALDPAAPGGPVFSAARLEAIGACPRRYFFHYVLGIEPPEEVARDPSRWLDRMQTGVLLHEVYYEFFREAAAAGSTPDAARDRERIERILAAAVERWRAAQPPPSEGALEAEVRGLRRAARIFLAAEAESAGAYRPEFLEVTIGQRSYGDGTPLDTAEPAEFPLGNGRSIRMRGRVDRVDRVAGEGAHDFAVWDYKTGSTYRYEDPDPFRQGRIVQQAVYARMIGDRLRDAVDPKAAISEAGYLFAGERGLGARRRYQAAELAGGAPIVARLCAVAAAGAFLATDDAKDCDYCDYRRICEDVTTTAASAGAKLDALGNDPLAPMRELRRND